MMHPLIAPQLNLNGNTAESLMNQLKLVLHNIDHLREAMRAANDVNHGRNFQTMRYGDDVARQAQQAWAERINMIGALHDEVITLAMEIQSQDYAKRERDKVFNAAVDKRIEQTLAATHPKGWESVDGGVVNSKSTEGERDDG
jgi:hypothetical protein